MFYRTKYEAQSAGKSLQKMMKTKGWKVRVWENCGWHCEIRKGYLGIWPVSKYEYMATISDSNPPTGTPAFWHEADWDKDPNKVVERGVARASKFVKDMQKIVKQMEDDIYYA